MEESCLVPFCGLLNNMSYTNQDQLPRKHFPEWAGLYFISQSLIKKNIPTDLLTGQSGGDSSSSMVHFLSMTPVSVS